MDTLRGVIHGKAIELEQDPPLPDGQQVTVILQPVVQVRLRRGGDPRRVARPPFPIASEASAMMVRP